MEIRINPLQVTHHGNTNQYNINGLLCTSHTDMLQLQCTFYQLQRGFGSRRQHARIQGFLSVLFSPQLILQFTEGSNGFIAEKTILILYQGSRGGPLFSRGGVKLFPGGGVQMLISLETHVRTCYFPGVGVSGPPIPLWIRHGQCHHNGTIFITVPLHNCQALICQN